MKAERQKRQPSVESRGCLHVVNSLFRKIRILAEREAIEIGRMRPRKESITEKLKWVTGAERIWGGCASSRSIGGQWSKENA